MQWARMWADAMTRQLLAGTALRGATRLTRLGGAQHSWGAQLRFLNHTAWGAVGLADKDDGDGVHPIRDPVAGRQGAAMDVRAVAHMKRMPVRYATLVGSNVDTCRLANDAKGRGRGPHVHRRPRDVILTPVGDHRFRERHTQAQSKHHREVAAKRG